MALSSHVKRSHSRKGQRAWGCPNPGCYRVMRSADRILEKFSERDSGEVRTLKGLLETDAMPIAVLGDVSTERSVVQPRDSIHVP